MNHHKYFSPTSVFPIFIALTVCLVVKGQTITGRISGTVEDSSGAVADTAMLPGKRYRER
jgi:hypothetical protein